MTTQVKTASVLAFERKLANSDGQMFSGKWEDQDKAESWSPLPVHEKSLRGTISNRQKNAIASDPLKLDSEVRKPNLQTVDVAMLPHDHDTVRLAFTLRVLADLDVPSACNDADYQAALGKMINTYIAEHGFTELSHRYAMNIANGRFLWRNRVGAEGITVRVAQCTEQGIVARWCFESHHFSLREFGTQDENVSTLAAAIEAGLKGEAFAFFKVEGFARLGEGQEVFPSQELTNNKEKKLYKIDDVAGLHSQKIGNALRTIDTWYPDACQFGPISVEPYGSVTNRGVAYRQPKEKVDFYTLLDNWVVKGKEPAVEQQHYIIAVLIRGGVFGESDKK